MSDIYDVLRYLIRNQGHANGAVEQDLLLTVDSAAQGFPDLETYKAELERQAREKAAQERAAAGVEAAQGGAFQSPAQLSDAQLAAEVERRAALRTAQSGNQTLRPGAPSFAGGERKGQAFDPNSPPTGG